MACGTPVVASQVGGLAYLVQDGVTGYVVPDGNPAALAGRLSALIQDPQLRRKLGQQASTAAREYAWPVIGRQVMELYEEMLSVPGSGR